MPEGEEEEELRRALALSLEPSPPPQPAAEEEQIAQAIALSLQQAGPAHTAEDDELNAALALSMQSQEQLGPVIPTVSDAMSFQRLLFGDASPHVMQQWINEGIMLAAPPHPGVEPVVGSRGFTAGLSQEQGGPCAVLAAAQAFLLRRLLFEARPSEPSQKPLTDGWLSAPEDPERCLLPDETTAIDALLRGLTDILWSTATTRSVGPPNEASVAVVAFLPPSLLPFNGSMTQLLGALLEYSVRVDSWIAVYHALRERLPSLQSPSGALSFLCSALLSRGLGAFSAERDDASRPLIDPQFGHCSQEGLNLLLLGQVRLSPPFLPWGAMRWSPRD